MSNVSTNFPRTFYKLSETWSKKTGRRTHKDAIFLHCSPSDPISHVPYLVANALKGRDDLVGELQTLVPTAHRHQRALWVYDMRASDAMPRTMADTERLYSFVRTLVRGPTKWFDDETGKYLEQHIHITVAFFVWWFTTQDFYFATKEIRQTTYHGIRRVWTPVLLSKAPVAESAPVAPKAAAEPSGVKHSAVTSAKELARRAELQERIVALVREEHPHFMVEWDDDLCAHLTVSSCFEMNSECFITGKKGKKLQKMYHDYSKLNKKGSVRKALAEAREEQQTRATPKAAPTQPEREVAAEEETTLGDSGCCELDDDETPDSWEDLM